MQRKNLALEITLVICALIAAFIVQAIIAQTKPPQMTDSPAKAKPVQLSNEKRLVVATELDDV